ncbi:MAG: universal stress protein [Thermodesulfobacteriota bacterium]|nr:universal stress protein [Thermodesulfobacteriota bacterium]
MFDKILLPLSFNENIEKVRELGEYLTNFDTRQIILLHVGTASKGSEQKLAPYRDVLQSFDFEVQTLFEKGETAETIDRVAVAQKVCLICFFWKRSNLLKQTILGSTIPDVNRITGKPIFIYRKTFMSQQQPSTILFATDFNNLGATLVNSLQRLGQSASQTLNILHVGLRAPDPLAERARMADIDQKLETLKEIFQSSFSGVNTLQVTGNSQKEIVKQASKTGTQIIVMGKFSHSDLRNYIMGSNSEAVSQKAKCSVFIIPHQEEA